MSEQFLSVIDRIIEENLHNEGFSVGDLAKNAGISRSMLHRKLMKLKGKSASDLIMEKRLLRARELLEHDVATAAEVSFKVGFNSPSYFNKVFKRHFLISPGAVRKTARIVEEQAVAGKENNLQKAKKPAPVHLPVMFIIIVALAVTGSLFFIYKAMPGNHEKSIAVLPFKNYTGQSENDYFVAGIHDALIDELGRISSIRVVSRTSTLRYADANKLLKDVAKELGVNAIVEGSVAGVGDSLRIQVRLIDVYPKERRLLTNEYNDCMSNALNVQSAAARDIAQKINIRLKTSEKHALTKTRSVDPETYKDYLRGMFYLNQGTAGSFNAGMEFLHRAIQRDPGDPFAYAGLALGYSTLGHGQFESEESFLRAMSAAEKAIALDQENSEAHTALSILYLYNVWNWELADQSFKNALNVNPNNAVAHAHYAWYHILFNDMDQCIYHAERAVMTEPFSVSYKAWLALLLFYSGNYSKAQYWAQEAIKLNRNALYANTVMSWVNLQKNDYAKAIEHIGVLPENEDYWKTLRGYVYVKAGQREKAMQYWKEMEAKKNL